MTTIPIEVIVQDASAPVVPSEDGTNNTETNIAVPDTGTISSSGDTSSSASSIILPAILLVLAIGSIVAILIHKHNKQKNNKAKNETKVTKKEKLAMAATSTIAVLVATVLVGNLVIPATKAATSDIEDGIVPSEDKVSIVVTRDGGSVEESIESTATITSTSDFGYKVLLSMAEGVETNNLYLDGNVDSDYYISATESTELSDNTWGYILEEDGEYAAVPLLDNAVTIAQGDASVEDEALSIYYGVMVSSDLPAGTYSGGEIEYGLVALEPTIGTLTYMQDFAKLSESDKAGVLRSMAEDQQYYLKDNRDDKTYRIAKLKDGNVWMTQNLDLQAENLKQGIVLDNTNTDNPASGFTLPTSQVSGNDSWGDSSNQADIETTHIYDIAASETIYKYCINFERGSCLEYGDEIPAAELGNLYNWYTATAGTGTQTIGSGGENPFEANGSICPAGWRLPNNSNSNEATDYSTLLSLYDITESPTSSSYISTDKTAIFKAPLSLIPSGYYGNGLKNVGLIGMLWSSLAFKNSSTRTLYFYEGNVAAWYVDSKIYGQIVRCIAK